MKLNRLKLVFLFIFCLLGFSNAYCEDEIYVKVEKKSSFKGGTPALIEYLQTNLNYPQDALDAEIEGRVFIHFTVDKDGSIEDIEVIRSVHPSLDKEAVRVVKNMPKWEPAEAFGKKVKSAFTLPVNFKLSPKTEANSLPNTEKK